MNLCKNIFLLGGLGLLNANTLGPTTNDLPILYEIFGEANPTDPTQFVEFGTSIGWTDDFLVIGAPNHGDQNEGAIFAFDPITRDERWSLMGTQQDEGIGKFFSLASNNLIAVRRLDSIEVYDIAVGKLVGLPIPSSEGGRAVSLSKNNVVAVSEQNYERNLGRVMLWELLNGNWTLTFDLIGMSPRGLFGWATSFSNNGRRLAISAPNADAKRGSIFAIERNVQGQWNPLGQILAGKADDDRLGISLAISGDGNTIVAGSTGRFGSAGSVMTFRFAENQWRQVGSELVGQIPFKFGRAVAVSYDGDTIAGASFAYNSARGYVGTYTWAENDWMLVNEFHGLHNRSRFGYTLHFSPLQNEIAVGSVWARNSDGEPTGKVAILPLDRSFPISTPLSPSTAPSLQPTIFFVNAVSPSLSRTESPTKIGSKKSSHSFLSFNGKIRSDLEPSEFGSLVQVSGHRVLVGAPQYSDASNITLGAVYVYDLRTAAMLWFKEGTENDVIGRYASLSMNGYRIAIRFGNTTRVYDIKEDGSDSLVGEPIPSLPGGQAVCLSSDGKLLAVGEQNHAQNAGRVLLYSFSQTQQWENAATLVGDQIRARFGSQLSFSDSGEKIAISAPQYGFGGVSRRGLVRVFENSDGMWTQIGEDILGEGVDRGQAGLSLDLSADGNTVVIGSPNNPGGGQFRGNIAIFSLNDGSWSQTGPSIAGEHDLDRYGQAVATNRDGSRIAATSLFHNGQRGKVTVFDFQLGIWSLALEVEGINQGDRLGAEAGLSLSPDGLLLAAGATHVKKNDDATISGEVSIHELPSRDGPHENTLSIVPTVVPVEPTESPVRTPSQIPTTYPSLKPSVTPSIGTSPTEQPIRIDTDFFPSAFPTLNPTIRRVPAQNVIPQGTGPSQPVNRNSRSGGGRSGTCFFVAVLPIILVSMVHQ